MSAKWISTLALMLLPAISQAAIIGMLTQTPGTEISIEKLPPHDEYVVQIAVVSHEDFPTLYFSRHTPGEGGNAQAAMEAMIMGRLPDPGLVSEWMKPDAPGKRPSVKVGVYTDDARFHIAKSAFNGQPREIPHVKSDRLSVVRLPDGRLKQVFSLRFPNLVGTFGPVRAGQVDIALVTQAPEPGSFDLALKTTLVMNSKKLMGAETRHYNAYRKELLRGMCKDAFTAAE